jgi:hypothetical protein
MTLPQEMHDWEEAHYIHTIQYFNELVRKHGAKQVLEDVRNLDLDTYDKLQYHIVGVDKKDKATAALLKDPYFRNAD